MLLRAVRAENFMRFSRLDLERLPLAGVIGIEGPNESGKSTIGELICFAFFGRMREGREGSLEQLIRWGAGSLWVEVEFTLEDKGSPAEFLIYREIDRSGTNYVKVLSLPEREEVATGNLQVEGFVGRHARFRHSEFLQAFYHDQYEDRRIQREQVDFFERTVGVEQLRMAKAELERENKGFERELTYYQKEIQRNEAQIEKYDRNVVKLDDLNERAKKLEEASKAHDSAVARCRELLKQARVERDARKDRRAFLEACRRVPFDELVERLDVAISSDAQLQSGNGAYGTEPFRDESLREAVGRMRPRLEKLRDLARDSQELLHLARDEREEAVRRLHRANGGASEESAREASTLDVLRRRWLRCGIAALTLGTLALVCCVALVLAPEDGELARWLPAGAESSTQVASLVAGGIALALFLIGAVSLATAKGARRRRDEALAEARRHAEESAKEEQLCARLGAVAEESNRLENLTRILAAAAESSERVLARRAQQVREAYAELLAGAESDEALARYLDEVARSEKEIGDRLGEAITETDKRRKKDEASRNRARSDRDRLENEIRECSSQSAKKEVLEEKNCELAKSAARLREQLELRLMAARLLDDTITSMKSKLGPTISKHIKELLPRLTAGRYHELKIEPDLSVSVYSSDKNDFLALSEFSGGTNEALALAVKLALSQTLVAVRLRQPQFFVLDEPFKMMDPVRSAETLRVLRSLSPYLKQFLVIQPDFSEEERRLVDCLVRTSPEGVELVRDCGLDMTASVPLRSE